MIPAELEIDRLDGGAVQVVRLEAARFGGEGAREPHRTTTTS